MASIMLGMVSGDPTEMSLPIWLAPSSSAFLASFREGSHTISSIDLLLKLLVKRVARKALLFPTFARNSFQDDLPIIALGTIRHKAPPITHASHGFFFLLFTSELQHMKFGSGSDRPTGFLILT